MDPKEFYSIENRKKMAKEMLFNEQEVLDLTKKELHSLWAGYQRGKEIASQEIKANFFCVPIDIWNHKEEEFKAILQSCMDEMKSESSEQ